MQEKLSDLNEEIARKEMMKEDASQDYNKLRMVVFDIKNEADRLMKDAQWQSILATSAIMKTNTKKVKRIMARQPMPVRVAANA